MKKLIFLFVILLIPAVIFAQGGDDGGGLGAIWAVLTAVFGILTSLFGVAFKKLKNKFGQILKLLKESTDVGILTTQTGTKIKVALEDGKLTQEEILGIAKDFEKYPKELADVKVAFKKLMGREL